MTEVLTAVLAVPAAAVAFGWAASRLGQPTAVGHMLAGIALGQLTFFAPAGRQAVSSLGTAGVLLYMFTVGLAFDFGHLRGRMKAAWAVSAAGLAAPFALGAGVAWFAFDVPGLFGAGVTRSGAAVFAGAALSITAFPMLARILEELDMSATPAGRLSLAAGCVDDVAAWILLTGLLAASGSASPLATPAVAFALGAACSRTPLASLARGRAARALAAGLLTFYLAKSGFNTKLDLVGGSCLPWTLAFLAAACLGKLGGCYWAARRAGESRKISFIVGALMNARGLMELIVLNIGLELGIIEPALFSMLAFMAVATTMLAAPLVRRAA